MTRSASHGQAAIRKRSEKNTKPLSAAVCRPAIASMWARPDAAQVVAHLGAQPVLVAGGDRDGEAGRVAGVAAHHRVHVGGQPLRPVAQRKALTAITSRSRQGAGGAAITCGALARQADAALAVEPGVAGEVVGARRGRRRRRVEQRLDPDRRARRDERRRAA